MSFLYCLSSSLFFRSFTDCDTIEFKSCDPNQSNSCETLASDLGYDMICIKIAEESGGFCAKEKCTTYDPEPNVPQPKGAELDYMGECSWVESGTNSKGQELEVMPTGCEDDECKYEQRIIGTGK